MKEENLRQFLSHNLAWIIPGLTLEDVIQHPMTSSNKNASNIMLPQLTACGPVASSSLDALSVSHP